MTLTIDLPQFIPRQPYTRVDLSLSSTLGIQPDSVFVKAILIYYWSQLIIRDLGPEEFSVDPLPSFNSEGRLSTTLRVHKPSSNHADELFAIRFECVDPGYGIAPCISRPFRIRDTPLAPKIVEETEPPNFGFFYSEKPTDKRESCRVTHRRVEDLCRRVKKLERKIN
jgi:hypothetical protein